MEFAGQIQHLAQVGLATHLIANAPDVDAVFTVARAKDMPGVRFAAAFADGTLAVGCPDGVPEIIAELAESIVIAPDAAGPQDRSKPGNVNDKIALLAQRIVENMPVGDGGAEVSAQLATLHDAITALVENSQDTVLHDINRKLDEIAASPGAPGGDVAASPDETQELGEVLAQLEDMTDTTRSDNGLAEIMSHISDIQLNISALAARDDTEPTALDAAFSGFEGRLVDKIAERLASVDTSSRLAKIVENQVALQKQVSSLAVHDRTPATPILDMAQQRQNFAQFATALNTMLQRFEGRLDELSDVSGPLPQPDFGSMVADLRVDLADHHNATVAALQDHNKPAKPGPAPMLDLTEQRRSFAVFTSALAKVVARLESTADDMIAALPSTESGADDVVRNEIGELRAAQAAEFAAMRADLLSKDTAAALEMDIADLEARFSGYGNALTETLAQFARIKDDIEALIFEDDAVENCQPDVEPEPQYPQVMSEVALEEAQAAPQAEPDLLDGPALAFPADVQAAFEDLRMDFAEMIAAQIRNSNVQDEAVDNLSEPKTA